MASSHNPALWHAASCRRSALAIFLLRAVLASRNEARLAELMPLAPTRFASEPSRSGGAGRAPRLQSADAAPARPMPLLQSADAARAWLTYREYERVQVLGRGQHGSAVLLRHGLTGECVVSKEVLTDGMDVEELEKVPEPS